MIDLDSFFLQQLDVWPLAKTNYDALQNVEKRVINFPSHTVIVQFNPARIRSTGAKVDAKSIAERPCFLCHQNRPKEQIALLWRDYEILVNPYPIFSPHFTVAAKEHTPQSLRNRIDDMLDLAAQIPSYALFYNGPHCGASAPDHAHFQICKDVELPLLRECINQIPADYNRKVLHFTGEKIVLPETLSKEDDFNAVAVVQNGEKHLFIIERKASRPWQYSAQGDDQIMVSPAAVEMCGVMITPRKEDFDKITPEDIVSIYSQTAF